jgi:hypothetical protein
LFPKKTIHKTQNLSFLFTPSLPSIRMGPPENTTLKMLVTWSRSNCPYPQSPGGSELEIMAGKITVALRALGASQILSGFGAILAIYLFVSHELLEVVGEEIMMDGKAIQVVALLLMFFMIATGVVSVLKVRWGWIFSFAVATFVLVMSLLMGPGTIPVTKWSFLGLMILSLINWSAAVVSYYHDLYT